MITYSEFTKKNIDLTPLGFERNNQFVPYYCTPENATKESIDLYLCEKGNENNG